MTDWLSFWTAILAGAVTAMAFAYWLVRKWREDQYDDGEVWDSGKRR